MTILRAALLLLCLALPLTAQTTSGSGSSGSGGSSQPEPPGTWYPLDVLNAGLQPPPDWIDRSTPQSAVESFFDAIDAGRSDIAAHMLDLSGLPVAEQETRGPTLAAQLHAVLERRAIISWRRLLERPDALDARQSSSAALAGEPRRSLLIGVLDKNDGREAAIRLNRVRAPEEDPVWLFGTRTVDQIPELYERYGPSDFEQALPEWLKRQTFFGTRLFETLGLPVAIILSGLAGWITYCIFKRLSHWVDGYWSRTALDSVRWPLILVVTTTVMLVFALQVFSVPGIVASILTPMVFVGYVVATLIFLMSILDTALTRMVTMDAEKLQDPDNSTIRNYATLMTAARRFIIVVGFLVGTGIVLASANVFRSLGFSLLASAGAMTLIIGFAARHVLGNILASLQIAINRSARIGDQIIYQDYFCTVERIHFTYVQLRNWDDTRIVVPVSHFLADRFENRSMVSGGMVCANRFTLHMQADLDAIRDRFHDLAEADDRITKDDDCKMIVVGQDAFGITTRFQYRVENPSDPWPTQCDMAEKILKAAQDIEAETGKQVLPDAGIDEMG